jgi:Fungal cellulose binding domain
MRDYGAVKSGVPTWVGNLPVGHGGTYGDPRGGKFGTAGQQFFRWVLRGDSSVSGFFTGNGAQADGWTVQSKSLGNINVSPLPTGTSAPTSAPTTAPTTAPNPTTTAAPQPTGNCASKWGQCGGQGWSGPTCCQSGSTCNKTNDWYSQCV